MKAIIDWNQKKWEINLAKPLDLSISMQNGAANPNAFGIAAPRFEYYQFGNFELSVANGSGANCENLHINAHGNGTHTECIGHITPERVSINSCLSKYHFIGQVISLEPVRTNNGDWIISANGVEEILADNIEALLIRSLPNTAAKLLQVYSGNNPVYLDPALCALLAQRNIAHLLVDVPSVDREEDSGGMLAHKAFWQYPENPRRHASISEMVFIPDAVADGIYFLNIQITALETDASPSKPVLYQMEAV